MKTLSFRIDGNWTSAEFAFLYSSLTRIYRLEIAIEALERPARMQDVMPPLWDSIRYELRGAIGVDRRLLLAYLSGGYFDHGPGENVAGDLVVQSTVFQSPGYSDLLGIGEFVERIGSMIGKLINLSNERELKDLEVEEKRAQVQALHLENTARAIGVLKSIGFEDEEIAEIMAINSEAQDILLELVDQRKVVDVEVVEDSDIAS